MAVTAANVQAFAPKFAAVPSGVIDTWLGMAASAINETTFGTDYDSAVMLWTCHHLQQTTGGAAGQVGAVTSRQAGDVRTTADKGVPDAAGMRTTAWGAAFLRLARRKTCGGLVL